MLKKKNEERNTALQVYMDLSLDKGFLWRIARIVYDYDCDPLIISGRCYYFHLQSDPNHAKPSTSFLTQQTKESFKLF